MVVLDNWSRDSTWRARANLSPSGYVERKVWAGIWEGSRSIVRTWGVRWAQWPTGSLLLLLTVITHTTASLLLLDSMPVNPALKQNGFCRLRRRELNGPAMSEHHHHGKSDAAIFPIRAFSSLISLNDFVVVLLEAWKWHQRCLTQCLLWKGCHNWPSDLAGPPCRWKVTLVSANDTLRLDGALIRPLAGGPGRERAGA